MRILLRRMQEILGTRKRSLCDMSLGFGTSMPYTFKQPKGIFYQTNAGNNGGSSAYTFTSIDIGAGAANRFIAVGVGAGTSGTFAIGSVVIDTTTASIAVQAGTTALRAGLVVAAMPSSSTSVSIVVSTTAAGIKFARCGIDVWRLTGLDSSTAVGTTSSIANPLSATLISAANGLCLGMAVQNSAGTITWTGLTEESDRSLNHRTLVSAADAISTSTSVTIAGTYSATDSSTTPMAVFASW